MPNPAEESSPEAILAHIKVLRAVDRVLDEAAELKTARDRLQVLIDERSELLSRPATGRRSHAPR